MFSVAYEVLVALHEEHEVAAIIEEAGDADHGNPIGLVEQSRNVFLQASVDERGDAPLA